MTVSQPPAAVALRRASFGYDGQAVVRDLTLRLPAGSVLALLGSNGSGKSTLVKGLLGLNEHLGGEVELFGVPLERLTDRSRIGYVPQRHTLSGSVRSTVREVVGTGRLSRRPWWQPARTHDREIGARALEVVGLSDRADADVATLSGGQQRRVLIARALAAQPEALVLDEPTAGVDAASQEVLATVLQRLAETGVTMLVVTHELAALRGVVQRIVEMDAGRVAFDGTPEEYAVHHAEVLRAASVAVADHRHGPDDGHHHDEEADLPAGPPLLGSGPLDARPRTAQEPR